MLYKLLKLIWDYEERDWISVLSLQKFNQKYEREEEKSGERKCWISVMWIPKFLYLILLPECERCAWSAQSEKKKKKWQTNCGNAIVEIGKKKIVTIVVMALSKMGGEKKVVPKSGKE